MTQVLHTFAVSYEWFVYAMTENCYGVGGMISQRQITCKAVAERERAGKRLQ